ncbi:MAG: DEAD/DEAH box helicase family protein, partial [Candidatus Aenigmarchaeota archaeon]|nr:DEAD/DEAH box helicase family protein [Candidatus Aenigmarchaeota archaeon]
MREGQKKFVDETTKSLKSKIPLLVHAPTGIGKTAAALAPAVTYAIENKKKVLFLTPRHAQHKIVIDTLKLMAEKYGRTIRIVDLVGKKLLCGLPESELMGSSEFQDYCKHKRKEKTCALYKNTYPLKEGELNESAKSIIRFLDNNIMHSDDAKDKCLEFCPYEIFTHRAKRADVIIADYFHMFHPKIRNAFLNKIKTEIKDVILIVDEAHNLPARARSL